MKRLINLYIITPIIITWILTMATVAMAGTIVLDGTFIKHLRDRHEFVSIQGGAYSVDSSDLNIVPGNNMSIIFDLDDNSNIKDSWILRTK